MELEKSYTLFHNMMLFQQTVQINSALFFFSVNGSLEKVSIKNAWKYVVALL